MLDKSKMYPRRGELVVGEIKKIDEYGAYIDISEYEKEGFIPRTEVSSVWVKDIKHFIKEKQRVVARVIRVNPSKGLIDLSLKAVREEETKKTLQEWKRRRKGKYLLQLVARKTNKSLEEVYRKIGNPFEREFGDVLAGFENIVFEGTSFLDKMKLERDLKEELIRVAEANIESPVVNLTNYVELVSIAPNGVERIKQTLIAAKEENSVDEAKIEITNVGSPRYRISVTTSDFKKAEERMKKIINSIIKYGKENKLIIKVLERKEARKGA